MSCPGCDRDDSIEQTGADAGRYTHCGMAWAVSTVPAPPLLAD